jgi:tellurite resistance-related uncharacterized protein
MKKDIKKRQFLIKKQPKWQKITNKNMIRKKSNWTLGRYGRINFIKG